ncbi:GGDEF domain-containing protein [Clostridium botulinum]|uniref:GGDEF domain-containing protein n=1 Tax=Clostridium botulinum TaxID=1491 RepID=UPI000773C392|nr:GGDEF domain-containing protein [Clostridium botulinum]
MLRQIFLIILFIFIVFIFIKLFINIKNLKSKIKELEKKSFCTKENNIIKEILDLNNIKNEKNSILAFEESAFSIIEILNKYYSPNYCTIFINKGRLITLSSTVEECFINDVEDHCNDVFYNLKNTSGKITYSKDYLDYKSALKRKIKYSYLIPLGNEGAIYIENRDNYEKNANEFELEFFNIVIKNITLVFQNYIYQDKLMALAMKDNLTKVYNRNYMNIHLSKQILKDKEFSLVILDIDNFKKINDNYGHDFGDLVLKKMSNFIKENIRKCDEIYRWGGEEFIIYFYNSNCKNIYKRLDDIRESISKLIFQKDNIKINITVSFGMAEYSLDGDTIENLIKCADKALYYSKENGKNKITIYNNM